MRKLIILISLLVLICLSGCAGEPKASISNESEQTSTQIDKEDEESPIISTAASLEGDSEKKTPEAYKDEYQVTKEISSIDFTKPGIYEIKENTIYAIDINKDGILENISITNTTHQVDVTFGGVPEKMIVTGDTYLTINDVDYEKIGMEWLLKAYAIKKESGNVGIVIFGDWMSENYLVNVYSFNGIQPVLRAENLQTELIAIDMNFCRFGIGYIFLEHGTRLRNTYSMMIFHYPSLMD